MPSGGGRYATARNMRGKGDKTAGSNGNGKKRRKNAQKTRQSRGPGRFSGGRGRY